MAKNIAGFTVEEWENKLKIFENNYMKETENVPEFRDLICDILKDETAKSFSEKTGLTEYMFRRMKKEISRDDQPWRNSLMSVCVAYNVSLDKMEEMLHSLGLAFAPANKRDIAYRFLLTECKGKNVDECNEILRELGIEEKYLLGHYARKKRPR